MQHCHWLSPIPFCPSPPALVRWALGSWEPYCPSCCYLVWEKFIGYDLLPSQFCRHSSSTESPKSTTRGRATARHDLLPSHSLACSQTRFLLLWLPSQCSSLFHSQSPLSQAATHTKLATFNQVAANSSYTIDTSLLSTRVTLPSFCTMSDESLLACSDAGRFASRHSTWTFPTAPASFRRA